MNSCTKIQNQEPAILDENCTKPFLSYQLDRESSKETFTGGGENNQHVGVAMHRWVPD